MASLLAEGAAGPGGAPAAAPARSSTPRQAAEQLAGVPAPV
jgi:hypothetical protein